MKRFEVLNRATPILRSYFLEASAGTGKTFAIEHIAVRALLEAKEPLSLEHMLIVTFTRAAARELKMRLRSNLVKVANSLQNSLPSFDYLQPIFEAGPSAVFSALRKVEDALCNFEKAQIFTLHGFCHKMLKEGAFEAGLSFDLQPLESAGYREALMQTIRDFFRIGLSSYGVSQVEGVLKRHKQSMEKLCTKILKSVERGVDIHPMPSFQDIFEEFQEKVKRFSTQIEAKKLLEDFQKLAPCYKKLGGDAKERQVESFAALLQNSSLEGWDLLLGEEDHFLELMHSSNLKARSKKPEPSSLHYPGFFDRLHMELAPLIESARSPEKNFLRMVQDCRERWEASSDFETSFSPDEILKKMASALQKREFTQKISSKYRVAIIDEFQDTDPIQWEIFRTLFLSRPEKMLAVYLVGDPKQSIYAFRNADVYTYLEAVKILGEENRVFLDTNYRADPALVHALNTLFTMRIAKKWMQLPTTDEHLEVREVHFKEALKEEDKTEARGRIHFFIASGASGRAKQWPAQEIEEEKFFPFLASEIKDLQKTQQLRYGQFAILVKDRYQARRIQSFFKTCDIPCSIKKNIELEDSAAYLALYDLLQAVVSPDDLSALKKVLGGSLIGFSAQEIIGHMDKEIFQQARVYFLKARGLIQAKGWGAFFQDFLSSTWKEKCVLEDLLSRTDPSLYFEMRQLFQILLEEVGQKFYSVEDLFSFFEQLSTLDPENEKLKISPEEEEDQVIVMTIHASKGLEFEVVFALGLCSRHRHQDDYVRTKVAGKEWLEMWDPSNQACRQASLEGDAEKLRHLYVALTRAKKRVYVPVAFDLDQRALKRGEASAIELLCYSFAKEDMSLQKAYEEIHTYTESSLVEHLEILKQKCSLSYSLLNKENFSVSSLEDKKELDLSFFSPPTLQGKKEFLLSFTSLSKKHHQEVDPLEEISDQEKEGMTSYTLPMGASTGTLLHRLLEILFKEELHHPFQEQSICSLIQDVAKESFLEGWEEVLFDIVKQTLHLPLLSGRESFCLKDVSLKQFFLEMEFIFPCGPHLIKGFIDAIFKRGDKYYIIDWKSNFLGSKEEDYSREKMEKAMHQHQYFLQAAIYAEALKRYIKLFEKRSFEECFGGAFYVFLRGKGLYHFYPDLSLVEHYDLGVEKLWEQ